ncbi:hypothetical protein JWJ88_18600 [Paracoccus methylovorus]|uniref:Uncharacterized protein n=1 Tax=Paracoccus methylovorus TaxID=2812658 RepID=A0ABX7JQA1_9RHOB|nr:MULTISPECIES: hypothetical protein [Paracoccus]QRZ16039.1 hypothetical protein JWJ88_18600 [Paracoccus methylovorus]
MRGRSIVPDRLPGADASGYAGLEDGVDYHWWWDLMKAAGLLLRASGRSEVLRSPSHLNLNFGT